MERCQLTPFFIFKKTEKFLKRLFLIKVNLQKKNWGNFAKTIDGSLEHLKINYLRVDTGGGKGESFAD